MNSSSDLWGMGLTCEGRRLTTPPPGKSGPVEVFCETEGSIRSVCVLLAIRARAEADDGAGCKFPNRAEATTDRRHSAEVGNGPSRPQKRRQGTAGVAIRRS
jgi:hypothetical protein